MSPTTPEICRNRFSIFPIRLYVACKCAVSRVFQRMAGKGQQCMQFMQTMAEWLRVSASGSMPKRFSRPSMTPPAVICLDVAFAPVRSSRRVLRNSKGDFYFKNGR